jgi:hypothetical protein
VTHFGTAAREYADLANSQLDRLGGTNSPDERTPIPLDAGAFADAQSAGGFVERIEENLAELERMWCEAVERASPLPEELVEAHDALPFAPE